MEGLAFRALERKRSAVALDHVDLNAGCIEQDKAPIVGNRSDVCLPIDEARTEVKVGCQQIVLADIDVLALERIAHSVEMELKRVPGTREVSTIGGLFGAGK